MKAREMKYCMVAEERHAMYQGIFSPSVRASKCVQGRGKKGKENIQHQAEALCKACTDLGTVAEATVIEQSC